MFAASETTMFTQDIFPNFYLVGHVGLLVGLLAIILLVGPRWPLGERLLGGGAILFLSAFTVRRLWLWNPGYYWDFRVFHEVGTTWLAGGDPYSLDGLLNPLTAVPLYALFGLLPVELASRLWLAFNVCGLILSTWLAWRLLRKGAAGQTVSESSAWVAAGCVALSIASVWGLDAGQVTVWTTLFLYLALLCQQTNRPMLAGMCLALATVKVNTMLPFVLLFLRKRDDLQTWLALACVSLVLCLIAAQPLSWPQLLRENLDNILAMNQPGAMNDYTFAAPYHDDVVALNRLLYCIGLRDRTWIGVGQFVLIATAGIWVLREVFWRRADLLAAAALVSIFSCLFLYHRLHDTIILALPLLYAIDSAHQEVGWRRTAFTATAVALIMVLNLPRGDMFRDLATWTQSAGFVGQLVQAIVLPYPMWLLLGALAILPLARRPRQRKLSTLD